MPSNLALDFEGENTACLFMLIPLRVLRDKTGFDVLSSTTVKCVDTLYKVSQIISKENSNTNSISFNHFTTEMPNYNKETTPDTTEIYSFFGQPGFNLFNASKPREKSKPTVSYSTVIVHGPNPKPSK